MRIEDGIVVGNVYNKYESGNPIARYLLANFHGALLDLIRQSGAREAHEVGCGEGYLSAFLHEQLGLRIRGSDRSAEIIRVARELHSPLEMYFTNRSIYDLQETDDSAPLIVCCEVLEHLEEPRRALRILRELARPYAIMSTPREPAWRIANMLRGKYIRDLGNTPGHVQHWSRRGLLRLLSDDFEVVDVRSPFPWTVALCTAR